MKLKYLMILNNSIALKEREKLLNGIIERSTINYVDYLLFNDENCRAHDELAETIYNLILNIDFSIVSCKFISYYKLNKKIKFIKALESALSMQIKNNGGHYEQLQ